MYTYKRTCIFSSPHSLILPSFLLPLPWSSGVEKREDHTSSVGDLLRDIETALDTVLDEREKQLQQQVRYRTRAYSFTPQMLLTMWCCLTFNYCHFYLYFHDFHFSFFCLCDYVTSSCFLHLLHAPHHSVRYTFNRLNLRQINTSKSIQRIYNLSSILHKYIFDKNLNGQHKISNLKNL
jgi:hypothetical protein